MRFGRHTEVDVIEDGGVDGFGFDLYCGFAALDEFAVGLVIGPFGGGAIALEFVEHVAVPGHGGKDPGIGVGIAVGFGEDLFERELFEAFDAGEFPAGLDHLADEEVFVFAFGPELVGEGGAEGGVLGFVLVGEDGGFGGGEAVPGRVRGGGGFAFGRGRARGVACVLAIREDLGGGCHGAPRVAGKG